MADDLKAQIVIEAQDRASAIIDHVAGELGVLGDGLKSIIGLAGPVGIALGTVAAALGGVALVGVKLADTVEQLDLLSTRTGVSAENLQVLQEQVKLMGGDASSLTTALTYLNRSIAQGDPLLKKLGITSKDVFTVFTQLSTIFANSGDSAKKAEIGFQLMGRGSAELLGVLPQLSREFAKTKEEMDSAGGIMKGEVLEAARKLDKAADDLTLSWDALMTKMRTATLPTALKVVQALNDMWDAFQHKAPTAQRVLEKQLDAVESSLKDMNDIIAVETSRGPKTQDDKLVSWAKNRRTLLEMQLGAIKAQLAAMDVAKRPVPGPDVIATTDIKTPDLSQREKDLKAFADRLGRDVTPEVVKLYDSLQRIDQLEFKQTIEDKLTKEGALEATMIALGMNRAEAEAFNKAMEDGAKKALDEQKKFAETLGQLDTEFQLARGSAKALFDEASRAEATGDITAFNDALKNIAVAFQTDEAGARLLYDVMKQNKGQGVGQLIRDVEDLKRLFPEAKAEALSMYAEIQKQEEERARRKAREELGIATPSDELANFEEAMNRAVSLSQVTKDSLDAVMNALTSGWQNALNLIIQGHATAGRILKTLWQSVVDAIIAELARIAAIETLNAVIGFVKKVLTGGVGLTAGPMGEAVTAGPSAPPPASAVAFPPPTPEQPAPAALAFPPVPKPVPPPAALAFPPVPELPPMPEQPRPLPPPPVPVAAPTVAFPPPPPVQVVAVETGLPKPAPPPASAVAVPGMEKAGGNTFVIQTLEARDTVRELLSPGGALRKANERLSYMGAY